MTVFDLEDGGVVRGRDSRALQMGGDDRPATGPLAARRRSHVGTAMSFGSRTRL
jgi:hypothetical protein